MYQEQLKEMLYQASLNPIERQTDMLISVIRKATGSMVASLWSVNVNSTKSAFWSASLMKRELPEQFVSDFDSEKDFVHELFGSFIEDTLNYSKKTSENYYISKSSRCINHLSYKKLEKIGLSHYVGIPVRSKSNADIIAVVCLYYRGDAPVGELDAIAAIIKNFLTVFFERMIAMKKQSMTQKLIDLKKKYGNGKSIHTFFSSILEKVLKDKCNFEGASIFVWDSYFNRFNLLSTTGLKQAKSDDEIFYYPGEGLTGNVSIRKDIVIYDSLSDEKSNREHIEKWCENTSHIGKTMIIVPILSVSRGGDVIGIIRIINKVNSENPNILDFFNGFDVELLKFFADQLSLILESYLNENLQSDFITRLTHEMNTPAVSISKSAKMLIKYYEEDNVAFIKQNLRKYLDDILYYSEFQKWQAKSTMFLLMAKQNLSLSKQYKVEQTTLKKILHRSKSIVNPIAREFHVSIDGIVIYGDIPSFDIYVDENAFVTVFYNLMTNAIKYNNPRIPFYMGINAFENDNGISVVIEDYGMGIEVKDKRDQGTVL